MLIINDNMKKHLVMADSLPHDWFLELCSCAHSFLEVGFDVQKYSLIAGEINVEVTIIQKIVESIAILFVECCKQKASVGTLRDWCQKLGLQSDQTETLVSSFMSCQVSLMQALHTASLTVPVYHNFDWRFDAHIGSRAVPENLDTMMTMRLALEHAGSKENVLLEARPAEVCHLAQELERALAASSAPHARRIYRRFSGQPQQNS